MKSKSSDTWTALFAALTLSKTEKSVVARFQKAPRSRAFLPVCEILKKHGHLNECLELLTQGLGWHPAFLVARVILARELFFQGLFLESWTLLSESPVPTAENFLAQKLRFELALILAREAEAHAILAEMHGRQMSDQTVAALAEQLQSAGLQKAREAILNDLVGRGISLVSLAAATKVAAATAEDKEGDAGASDEEDPSSLLAATTSDSGEKAGVRGFCVVPVANVFLDLDETQKEQLGQSREIDSTTLAELYEKQALYGKALDIYRRLLTITPKNEYLLRKVALLSRLKQEQKKKDMDIDPKIVDQMEAIEIIDKKIRFYKRLLEKIDY